jgi:Peptidase inhibitor family I36
MTSTHGISFIAALLLAAIIAAVSFALAVPERASAGPELCPRGHFCIWEHAGYHGGMFNRSSSQPSLYDDFFLDTRLRVANEGTAVYNNGYGGRGVRDDVLVYLATTGGPSLCIPRGKRIPDLTRYRRADGQGEWNDNIVRYRWVKQC